MVPQKYLYFLRRFFQMGPRTTLWLLYHRLQKRYCIKKWKKKWQQGFTYHSWHDLQKLHNLNTFEIFFNKLAQKNIIQNILDDKEFIHSLPTDLFDVQSIIANADKACMPEVRILGYGTFNFINRPIPWHNDFATQEPSPTSWTTSYFSEITIPDLKNHNLEILYPDIKVPWELSRFHHFFILGLGHLHAQQHNDQARLQRYAQSFVDQTSDWMTCNPFGQGVNWINPMEVSIRAINFIWAFDFFKQSLYIPQSFWEQFVCMLHDHALYLQKTWEVSQKPNNHYIADLLGHLYLTTVFSDIKLFAQKRVKTVKKLIEQWNYQILPDHTSYEGSTQYHKLVTEMMMHFLLLSKYAGLALPTQLQEKYMGMKQFLAVCNGVHIGDDDSGKIVGGFYVRSYPFDSILPMASFCPERTKLTGQTITAKKNHYPFALDKASLKDEHSRMGPLKTYPHFGLSIMQAPGWHVTFRHPTYQTYQPSGHFHHDALSITLMIDDIPIIVDPGTYVYTANGVWRNKFRGSEYHNAFFLSKPIPLPSDLFQLGCQQHSPVKQMALHDPLNLVVQDNHNYYQNHGLIAHRSATLACEKNSLIIVDWWKRIGMEQRQEAVQTTWTIHFAPEITLKKHDDATWYITKTKTDHTLAKLTTTRCFTAQQGWISSEYGSITPGTTLIASYPQTDDAQSKIIEKLKI